VVTELSAGLVADVVGGAMTLREFMAWMALTEADLDPDERWRLDAEPIDPQTTE